ncbi:MAG: glycosyltransferase, partial [Treponema sp.]
MKVLLVTKEDPGHLVGGLGTFIRDFSAALKVKIDVRIMLVRLNRREDPDSKEDSSTLVDYVVSVHRSCDSYDRDVLKAEEANEILAQSWPVISEWQPDVIHLNDRQVWMPFRNLPNTVFSLHLSMPDLVGLRGLDTFWFNELKVEKDACARAGALVVYSKFMQKVVWDKLCDFASPLVLPLGFDSSRYHTAKPDDRIVISYFGRLAQGQKGFVEYLQAVDLIDQSFLDKYDVEFNVYGKGEMPDWLPVRRITNIAFLEGDELTDAFAQSHVVVMPSKYEPFGLVGLEALASGCVLLATEGQGMDEYLIPGKNYVAIRPDPFDIKQKLEQVLTNPGKYFGREHSIMDSVSRWTWDRCVNEHLKVYHQVMTGRAPFLKWANGKIASSCEQWWKENGDKRKSLLEPVFQMVSDKLHQGKILVIGATEHEIVTYSGEGRELIPHSFYPRMGYVNFHTEYILIPPDSVDESVFIYGPEFVPNFDLSMRELYRITKHTLIIG